MVVPLLGTEQWIKSLNLTIVNDWRPWFVDGQVAGYTQKYSEHGYRLTYATVKGAGHPALEYYRREGYEMFQRWIHWYPL
ncbi:putative serine carboxypeptidase-like 52 [Pistacia vera]|uniref:putative serine carboxypeptidase-like 52 n=1 Tax=Pistacia vera TaxID=55513 RepID=UPI001262CEF5|nr:putative serine carboxypeptidase-like 52 [Pistacia vera]